MRSILLMGSILGLLGACAQADTYGTLLAEKRRLMNDQQARLTLAATCDISLGAFYRQLNALEQHYAELVCGGLPPEAAALVTPAVP